MRLSIVIALILLTFSSADAIAEPPGKSTLPCLDAFRTFTPIAPALHPPLSHESYVPVAVWYTDSRCLLVGSTTGLWLYAIDQPDSPLQLARLDDRTRAINHITVNPANSTIAFSVSQEPTVYLVQPGNVSTLKTSGQAVTAISFSPDGSLIGVASNLITDEVDFAGLYYDSRVQIWNSARQYQTEISLHEDKLTSYKITKGIFFSGDNRHLLKDSVRVGYDQDVAVYWDLATNTPIWTSGDLFGSLTRLSPNDPLVPSVALLHDQTVALGGLDGWHDYDDYYGNGIHLWDVTTQQRKQEIVVFERGIGEEAELIDMAFNSAGTELVSSQSDGTIKFWNVLNGEQIGEFSSELASPNVAFSPDDRFLALVSDTEILIWDIAHSRAYTIIEPA